MNRDVCINVFVDGHKQSDVIEDCASFLKRIKEFKSYIVEFNQDKIVKPKVYLFDCTVGGENC